MPYAVDLLKRTRVESALKKAEKLADFTIVCPHWGTEYQLEQSSTQKAWANLFAENGADLVVGTHPHVIQPIEWIVDEKSKNKILVFYSLGNFVNWTANSGEGIANRMVGGMAKITLSKENDKVFISNYDVEPLVCHLETGTNGVTVYKLDEYTKQLADKNQIRLQDSNFSLDYCEKLCETVWDNVIH